MTLVCGTTAQVTPLLFTRGSRHHKRWPRTYRKDTNNRSIEGTKRQTMVLRQSLPNFDTGGYNTLPITRNEKRVDSQVSRRRCHPLRAWHSSGGAAAAAGRHAFVGGTASVGSSDGFASQNRASLASPSSLLAGDSAECRGERGDALPSLPCGAGAIAALAPPSPAAGSARAA
jgi:hypothetical protein